jgi:hypothetical protein
MIVLDANILIRAVLGRHVRELLEEYAGRKIRFYAPDGAFADAEKYLPPLLEKRGKPNALVSASLNYLQTLIESIDQETYGDFEEEAGSGCAGAMRKIGRSLPRRWHWHSRYGLKIRTSLEPALPFGLLIASRFS